MKGLDTGNQKNEKVQKNKLIKNETLFDTISRFFKRMTVSVCFPSSIGGFTW